MAGGLAAAVLAVLPRPDSAAAAGLAQLPTCQTAGQGCVTVKVVNGIDQVGDLRYFTASDVQSAADSDVASTTYDIPGTPGVRVDHGTSVARLLELADVPTAIEFVEVDGPDRFGRHLLTNGERQATGADGRPPVMYAGTNSTNVMSFVRTQRTASEDQGADGPDKGLLLSDQDAALEIVVHLSGQPLDVSVTATPVAGSNDRTFTLASDASAGRTTTWVFPDGSTSTEASPTYTFPASTDAGNYPVSVAVEDPGDGAFGWGTTGVQVGAAPTPSASPSASPGTGGQGGGHHGSSHGHHSGAPHPGHGSGTASPTATAAASPTATATAAPTAPATSATSAPTQPPASEPPSSPSPRPSRTPTATPTPTPATGEDVTGVLLTAAETQPSPSAGGQVLDVPSPSASAAPAVDPPFRIATGVWLVGGGLVLLGAGAASESARVRRRLGRLLGRPLTR